MYHCLTGGGLVRYGCTAGRPRYVWPDEAYLQEEYFA